MIKKQTKFWKCKDGTKIRICDMTDSHLLNCIKFLEKKAIEYKNYLIQQSWSALAGMQGEMAIMSIEDGIEQLEDNGIDPSEEYPIYNSLVDEAERRELKIWDWQGGLNEN